MRMKNISLSCRDGKSIIGNIWIPNNEPKAILQITHGMTEHIGRYTRLADALTAKGIIVAGFDLRGHGANANDPICASFGKDGWEESIEDMHLFYEYLEKDFSGHPHFMLGFSLGSFLLREYLCTYPKGIAGAAILGTGYQPKMILSIMSAIVKTQIAKNGFDNTTPLVKQLSFGTYNQKFKPNRTNADWLCADEKELDKYLADPLCREQISSGLFWQLLNAMKRTGKTSSYDNWDKSLSVLLLSGKDDPVGDFGKGVEEVNTAMKSMGIKDVTMRLFPCARHDILHEEHNGCAEQARELLGDWILKNI